jgi:hypothetical protein
MKKNLAQTTLRRAEQSRCPMLCDPDGTLVATAPIASK